METIKKMQTLLRYTFGIVPIVAGLDKFTNLLVDWPKYIGSLGDALPLEAATFMMIVGVIEIVAGLIVLVRPLIGSYIVMAWLIAIAITLIITGYYDVAVRDLVMAIAAFVLARLTLVVEGRDIVSS